MITASHNPPSDNAVKVYWSTGGQLLPPHDADAISRMKEVTWIKRIGFAQGMESGRIVYCQQEVDATYVAQVALQSTPGARDLKIIYSPLHGVGTSAVCPVLDAVGFKDVKIFGPHAAPDPDFSNVPNHVANPENSVVFDAIIEEARKTGADLILATDPDCDRVGCATPISREPDAPWTTLTGNQIGSLLADYLLALRQQAGTLTAEHYVVKTLVTTELIRRIADHYGAQTAGNLLVGFKWIGGEMDRRGPDHFVLGAEESYGFLAGQHVRDKDAAVSSMLLAELAAQLKAEGRTLCERLDELFEQHGCHTEKTISIQMPGEQGMDDMKALMAGLRSSPPTSLGGLQLAQTRDYQAGTVTPVGAAPKPLDGPTGDMVFFDLQPEGNAVAVRPSGTESKVKFYMFAYDAPEADADLQAVKTAQANRLAEIEQNFRTLVTK
jgi:phosphoglucomutase/phosphomannomutase